MNSSSNSAHETPATHRRSRAILVVPIILVGVLLALIGGGFGYAAHIQTQYQDGYRIYPGVHVESLDLSGLTETEAREKITPIIDEAQQKGLTITLATSTLLMDRASLDKIVHYMPGETAASAMRVGRTGTRAQGLITILRLSLNSIKLPIIYKLDGEAFQSWLQEYAEPLVQKPQSARIVIDPSLATSTVRIQPEVIGHQINTETALNELEQQAARHTFSFITLETSTIEPSVRTNDLLPLQTQAETWLKKAPFAMTIDQRSWNVTPLMLAGWITATATTPLSLTVSPTRLAQDIDPWISYLLHPAKDGNLVLENGAFKDFIAPEEGVTLAATTTIANVLNVLEHTSTTAPIVLSRVTPRILGKDAEEMGIREVIGTGYSSFPNSPANRRVNIALGAKHVNGSLIAPNGEFSLLKALGPIDAAHDWLPELVIKGNKTTPEYGGGLCQIGTTVFRGAMDSGLEITERRNHSYRVSYYEPAGTDATIYDPAPDFKFKNDTNNWVLITTKVSGDNLIFSYWGTRDGRRIDPIKPVISNIVAPPPKKLIPTTDLPVGKTKCTESAHAGATARLDYVVHYASGESKKTVFNSYYKPWGAVCLVGAEKAPVVPSTVIDETGINNPN